jgi:hypothetical protein
MGSLLACKKPEPMCARVLGRWQGEGVEGVSSASVELHAVMRAAVARERWTLSRSTLVREGVSAEQVREAVERDGQCAVTLAREDRGGSSRALRLSVGEDEKLRAVSLGGAETAPVVVLHRAQ